MRQGRHAIQGRETGAAAMDARPAAGQHHQGLPAAAAVELREIGPRLGRRQGGRAAIAPPYYGLPFGGVHICFAVMQIGGYPEARGRPGGSQRRDDGARRHGRRRWRTRGRRHGDGGGVGEGGGERLARIFTAAAAEENRQRRSRWEEEKNGYLPFAAVKDGIVGMCYLLLAHGATITQRQPRNGTREGRTAHADAEECRTNGTPEIRMHFHLRKARQHGNSRLVR